MKNLSKKLLSIFMAAAMVVTMLPSFLAAPVTASAADGDTLFHYTFDSSSYDSSTTNTYGYNINKDSVSNNNTYAIGLRQSWWHTLSTEYSSESDRFYFIDGWMYGQLNPNIRSTTNDVNKNWKIDFQFMYNNIRYTANDAYTLGLASADTGSEFFGITSNGNLCYNGTALLTGVCSFSSGTTYTMSYVYNGGRFSVYIDGVKICTYSADSTEQALLNSVQYVAIGSSAVDKGNGLDCYDLIGYEKQIAVGTASYLTDEASFDKFISDGTATKTGTVTWDSTENAAYFNGGYLVVNDNPLKSANNSTGFTISFDYKRLSTNEDNSRMIDINDGTTTNTFAINAGSDSENNWRRLLTLAKVGGTESNMYANDLGNGDYCTYTTSGICAENPHDWHNLTVIMDASGYYSYYFDGVLRGTFRNDYNTIGLSNGVTPTQIKNQMASMTQVNIGKAIYNDPTFKGYIKNVHIVAQDVNDTLSTNATIDDAISFTQAKFASYNNYTNQAAAYKAYYNACEAMDATEFGNDSGKLNSSRTALIAAVNNMGRWTKTEYVGNNYGYTASGQRIYENDSRDGLSNYVKLAYCEKGLTASGGRKGNLDVSSANNRYWGGDIYSPEVTMIYDGFSTKPQSTVLISLGGTNTGKNASRYVIGATMENGNGLALTDDWHGEKDGIGNLDFNWGWDTRPKYLANNTGQTSAGYLGSGHDLCLAWRNGSRYIRFVNQVRFTADMTDPDEAYRAIAPSYHIYMNGSDSYRAEVDSISVPITTSTHIRVINYRRIADTIEDSSTQSKLNSAGHLADYKEGNAESVFENFDVLTAWNNAKVNSYFTSSNNWNGLQSDITGDLAGMNTAGSTADTRAAAYQALRDTLKSERTIADTDYTIAQAYANLGDFSDATSFKNYYEAAVAIFAALDNNDNASGYAANSVSDLTTLNTNLAAAFAALDIATAAVPTVSAGKYLGKNDTVTVTNNERDDQNAPSGTMSYVVTYNDSTTQSGSVADGGTINIFNGATDKTSASLVITLTLEGETYDSLTYNYTYIAAPRFTSDSAGNTTATQGVYPLYVNDVVNDVEVYAYSNNSFGDASSQLQYSYDGNTWTNVSNGGAIFAFDTFAGSTTGASTIQLREEVTKDGKTCYSEITTFTVIQENTFTIFTNNTTSTSFYDASSTINIEDTTHYSDDIIFYIKKANGDFILEGGLPKKYTYSKGSGIRLSGAGAFEDAETILGEDSVTIYAYSRSADAAGYDNRVSAVLTNVNDFDKLIYHESFNGSVSNGTYTTNDSRGVNITQQDSGTISVVEKAGDRGGFSDQNETGTSGDMRKNALKISGSNSGSNEAYAKLASNPLTKDVITKAFVKANGVTISFWRAMESAGTTNKADIGSGTLKRDAIAFRRQNPQDERDYYMIELTGNMSYAETASDYFDIVPSEYDQTQFTASKYSGYWQHIAVTINPKAATVEEAITVYINGVPHDYPSTIVASGGDYAAASDTVAKTIGDLLDMMTTDTVDFCLAHDNKWQSHSDDIYLDDIRVYAGALTQKEIWDSYYDENADTPTVEGNKASVTHDPTTVTVYKLKSASNGMAAGSMVGQEFVDYYSVPASNYDIEYYSYGTGLQIYHSTDNVNWEIVGDSEGRVAYQNRDEFVKDNGDGTFTPMYYREALDEVCDEVYNMASSSQKAYAGNLIWAPHVSYNLTTNKWMMYVSVSFWGDAKSAIIALESVDGTPVHFKARTSANAQAYDVVLKSNGRPNAIDPCSYYKHNADGTIDKDTLYLSYGAWSQSNGLNLDVYTIQLTANGTKQYSSSASNPVTFSNAFSAGSGTHICSSQPSGNDPNTCTGEGSFIIYHDGYYYLYIAYGVNEYNYVTRVFRSTSPNGGFVDYNGTAATSTSEVHGTQIMAPHYMVNDNYIYVSTGHDSVYKTVNNSGETVLIHSAHGRPVSNEANNYKELPDVAMITRQKGKFVGNVTITHPMFFTKTGWTISMPEQYNGTDTSHYIKASQIDGLYSSSTLHDIVDSNLSYSSNVKSGNTYSTNWDFSKNIYFSHETDTTGIIYGDGTGKFLALDYTYELSYDTENPEDSTTTYITVKDGSGTTVAEGVVAMHNGTPELSYFNISEVSLTGVPTRASSTVWSVKSGDLPEAADFTALDSAYAEGDALLKSLDGKAAQYSAESVQALITAVNAAKPDSTKSNAKKRLVPASSQSGINTEETNIRNAIAGLTPIAAEVPAEDFSTYEAAVSAINNLDPDAYEEIKDEAAPGGHLASAMSTANALVSSSTKTYTNETDYTINVVDSTATASNVDDAVTTILDALTYCTKTYAISGDSGVATIGGRNGTYNKTDATHGTATYGTIISFTGASEDTAWTLEVRSNTSHKKPAFYGFGRSISVKATGALSVTTQTRGNNQKRVKIIRNYSDSTNERAPIQYAEFIDAGSYTLPSAANTPAIAFYDFDGYYIGETKYAAGATVPSITEDTEIIAKYIYNNEASYAITATALTGGTSISSTYGYNAKIELEGGEGAYGWSVDLGGGNYRPFYVGADVTFYAMESLNLVAETEATFKAHGYTLPEIYLRSGGVINVSGKVTFNAQAVANSRDDIKECGILIAVPNGKQPGSEATVDPVTPLDSQVIVENSGQQVGYAILRAKSTKFVGANQFAIAVKNLPEGYIYRAYVIYNHDGALDTVYTDVVR